MRDDAYILKKMETTEKILKTLNDFGMMPSSKICAIAGVNYDYFKKASEELLKKKLISKKEETLATYWEITEKGKREVKKQ
jgi:predicted transcriptional regulator